MNAAQMPGTGTPIAEFQITTTLVKGLLADQHPDLAGLSLQLVGEGWDNTTFRLGDNLAVRLPRRAAAASLICHEQTWLPRLANQLPLPVPMPLRIGTAARGYPWGWSVVPWLVGEPADRNEPAASQAIAFGTFLRSLHVPAPDDAPANPWRGGPLHQRALAVEERMQRLAAKTNLITTQIREIWQTGSSAPIDVPATWLHGDLHPFNILVERGIISGVIDWGDITSGDCATDLAAVWMLFADPQARNDAFSAYAKVSEATMRRAKAWAVLFGTMFLDTGLVDNPASAALGKKILQNIGATPGLMPPLDG